MKIKNLLIFLLILSVNLIEAQDVFKVGLAKIDITPPFGSPLGGYGGRTTLSNDPSTDPFDYSNLLEPSIGVHDRLWAKAVVIKNSNNAVVIISVDAIGADINIHDELFYRVSDLGFPQSNLYISGTHTHSGPAGIAEDPLWQLIAMDLFNEHLYTMFLNKLETLVREAWNDAENRYGKIGFGFVENDSISHNRRDDNIIDPEIGVIKITDTDDNLLAVIFNFPIHGTCLGDDNLLFSGDCMGYACKVIEETYDDQIIALYVNGAEGDIAPNGSGFEGVESIGSSLANSVLSIIDDIPVVDELYFNSISRVETLPEPYFRPYFFDDNFPIDLTIPLTGWLHNITRFQALRLNNYVIVTIPGEAIVSIGLELKDLAQEKGYEKAFIFGLTNDHLGYILTEEEYWQGGYEAGACFFGPEFHDIVVNILDEMMDELLVIPTPTPYPTASPTVIPTEPPATPSPSITQTPTPTVNPTITPTPSITSTSVPPPTFNLNPHLNNMKSNN